MKIFGDYLRRHLGGIGILLACCGIFVLVFSLYDLPAEAVLYGGVLSAVLYLFWFLVRFRKYYQKCRTLRQMQQEIVITTRTSRRRRTRQNRRIRNWWNCCTRSSRN